MDFSAGAGGSIIRTPDEGAEWPAPEIVSFWAVRCYPEARPLADGHDPKELEVGAGRATRGISPERGSRPKIALTAPS